jgi:predicted amidohydrolase
MTSSYQIAVAQASFENGDISNNLSKMEKIANQCIKTFPNVRLLLFPELAVTGYFLSETIKQIAQEWDGFIFERMSRLAERLQLYIAYGYVEKDQTENIYNSLMLVSPKGKCVGNYRKIHVTPLEKSLFTPGSKPVIAETELGRIGLMLCWDLAFPELARHLAVKGAELLLVPCAWESPFHVPFQKFCMARAIDNTIYLAACNQIGACSQLHFFGLSSIYGPDGNQIASAKENQEDVIIAEVDHSWREELKRTFYTMMDERRTDLYKVGEWIED